MDKYADYMKAKKDLIDLVRNKLHMIIEVPDATGKGGTSTNGNTVCNILGRDEGRRVLASLVPDDYRDAMEDVLLRIWLIMEIYNGNEEVDEFFPEFCNDTCILFLTSFNPDNKLWIYLTPTLHGLFHHTWELIQGNENFGLQEYSESAIESNMIFMRFYREFLARKLNQHSNLSDCFTRMWLKSDPEIRKSGKTKKSNKSNSSSTFIRPFTKEQYYKSLLLK